MLTNQELTLLPNASRSCVNISILDDLNTEGTEQFELTLQTNSSSALLTESSTTVSIEDDDCKFSHLLHYCYYCYLLFCRT